MFSGSWTNLPDVAADGEPKATPPKATPKVLPQPLVLKTARVTFHKNDTLIVKHIRTRFKATKLRQLEAKDFRKLNISSTGFLPPSELLPEGSLPPDTWLVDPQVSPDQPRDSDRSIHIAVLSNGTRRPDRQKFYNFAKELRVDLATIYRSLRRDPPPKGLENIKILQFRGFWIALHNVGRYWDDSLDPPETTAGSESKDHDQVVSITHGNISSTNGMDIDTATSDNESASETSPVANFTYTGRRTSTGSQMGSILSLNLAEAFLGPLMYAFGCHFDQVSSGVHDLFLIDSIATCVHTKLIYSRPKDPALAKQGVLEGPIAVLHAHASVEFGPDTHGEIDIFVRELKAILLCAQQRSRENEQAFFPGGGEWWGLPRGKWGHALDNGIGGLPGEAVGQPFSDLDLLPKSYSRSEPLPTNSDPSLIRPSRYQGHTAIIAASEKISEDSTESHDDEILGDSTLRADPAYVEFQEDSIKVAPLAGEELRARLLESTLADPALYLGESESDPEVLSSPSSDSETVSSTSDTTNPTTSKKRSFRTFASYDNSSVADSEASTTDSNPEIMTEIDTERTEFSKKSGLNDVNMPSSETATNIGAAGFALPPDDHEPVNHPGDWYKSMLENLRSKSEFEQKARRTAIKLANQPAKNPFHSRHKEMKRIGMHPLASQDEIYLISVLNHHIAFVHLKIDHKVMDWLSPNPRERARVISLEKDTSTWWGIPLRRSRWYDFFNEQDRVEALRVAWTIFGRMMADTESDREAEMRERERSYGTM